jgi:hypothetical protein
MLNLFSTTADSPEENSKRDKVTRPSAERERDGENKLKQIHEKQVSKCHYT